MSNIEFKYELKRFGIKDEYELLEKYKELRKEVRELKDLKGLYIEKYNKMSKIIITYMDKYGSLDNKKGKENGVRKQI